MVSLQAATLWSQSQGKKSSSFQRYSNSDDSNNNKKRKREVDDWKDEEELVKWSSNKKFVKARPLAVADVELHLEDTPILPPEWQRCLDIKSGKMYYYNSRTRTTTCRDPTVGIDLELNLGWNSGEGEIELKQKEQKPKLCIEMAATVCIRCHMLVMICRSSPSCPNCKFVQSPGLQLLDCNLRCLE